MDICKYEAIYESYLILMMAEMWKSTPRNKYTQNSKINSNKLKEQIFFILKIHYSSQQKEVDK